MHYTFQLPEFLVQNSLSAPRNVGMLVGHHNFPPPPPKMQIWTDLDTLGWVGLDHHHPSPWKMQIWADLDTLGWVGLDPPPPTPPQCRFGQILALWVELVWTTTSLPPPENADLDRSWHFRLSWSSPPHSPPQQPPLKMQILTDLGTLGWVGPRPWKCRFGQILVFWVELVWTTNTPPPPRVSWSSYVETNCCILLDTI